jgi:hypothetical protein
MKISTLKAPYKLDKDGHLPRGRLEPDDQLLIRHAVVLWNEKMTRNPAPLVIKTNWVKAQGTQS